MTKTTATPFLLLCVLVTFPGTALFAQNLRGSAASLDRQNHQASLHDFTYLETPAQVRRFVEAGYLVHLSGNGDYRTHNVSFPYARPEAKLFVERLARQYRSACGEQLVVTSATRPRSHQPRNASTRSVHPTGMAIDLRVSQNARCRSWLERTLLSLEGRGVIEAIRERNPPHYHLAIYPQPYATYVAQLTGQDALGDVRVADAGPAPVPPSSSTGPAGASGPGGDEGVRVAQASAEAGPPQGPPWETIRHRVRRGESLWTIARANGTTVERLAAANGIAGSRIVVGQLLNVPLSAEGGVSVASGGTPVEYRVRRGDSLWTIARAHGTTVDRLRAENELRGSQIYAGQVLSVPSR